MNVTGTSTPSDSQSVRLVPDFRRLIVGVGGGGR